ncbi:MAG: hypothetical protein FJ312_01270 [SAR202 cluster bacterium]|nr:hypothetical protein [SAR202 cluster bacterium]
MDKLMEILDKAIADFGFRQMVLWSADDVAARWGLSPQEAAVLRGRLRDELEKLPVPVEPADRQREHARFVGLIAQGMKK